MKVQSNQALTSTTNQHQQQPLPNNYFLETHQMQLVLVLIIANLTLRVDDAYTEAAIVCREAMSTRKREKSA